MALSEVLIYRDYQIINGYVQVPGNAETDKNRVTVEEALDAVAGSQEVSLSAGSGPCTGGRHGAQRILRLPGLIPGATYDTDPVDDMAGS